MAPSRAKMDGKRHQQQSLKLKPLNDQVRPSRTKRKQSLAPTRKSARLQEKQRRCLHLESLKQGHPLSSPANNIPTEKSIKSCSRPLKPPNPNQKRNGAQTEEVVPPNDKGNHKQKRQNKSSLNSAAHSCSSSKFHKDTNPIECWRRNNYIWPSGYFDRDLNMSQPLTRKRSSSMRSQALQSSQKTSVDLPREAKSATYKDPRYEAHLATAGGVMDNPPLKITDAGKTLCQQLLAKEQSTPADSLFSDERFETTCSRIRNENEARVIKDITWLIIASAETLATYGATELDILIEKVNSSWLKCFPLTSTRPQPDYSVGFRASAFTKDQVHKLSSFVGSYMDQCSVMAREDMYFPFLTCEVKCGEQALAIADRQNMHSASVSVKGIVELFRRVKRQNELHRTILAFSLSHDNEAVRIYGHYPLVNGENASFYRHLIRKFDIMDQDGKDKWTAYKFTKNVYTTFAPSHLKRICAVVDQLPDPGVFDVRSNTSFVSNPHQDEEGGNETTLSSSRDTDAKTRALSQTTLLALQRPSGKIAR